jgi:hypothetical protein
LPREILIDPLSGTSLRVLPKFGETVLGKATGFTIRCEDKLFLVTNWHVVSGRSADTLACLDKKKASIPDRLTVSFHAANLLGQWIDVDIPLLDQEGRHDWIEHPTGHLVDVVALLLPANPAIEIFPLDLALAGVDLVAQPAAPVCVIGFPFGLGTGGNWPIWKTGHIASDPSLDYEPGKPAFLIDATTRSGMSGSPVIIRMSGGFPTAGGGFMIGGGTRTRFVGIYSGRIHAKSEVGRVWRPFVLEEILKDRLIFNDDTGRPVPPRNANCPCNRGKKFKDCCGRLD